MKKFSDGRWYPEGQSNAYGYIGPDGKWRIPPQFDFACDFAEDRALVRIDGRYGFIDRSGRVVVPCELSSGRAHVSSVSEKAPGRGAWGEGNMRKRAGAWCAQAETHVGRIQGNATD
jgi:ABC-type phosphonate transport system ATPase subunit